jgi:hypothetical protein
MFRLDVFIEGTKLDSAPPNQPMARGSSVIPPQAATKHRNLVTCMVHFRVVLVGCKHWHFGVLAVTKVQRFLTSQ